MVFLAQIPKEQLIHQLKGGLILMILGLTMVFIFLTLLIFLIKGTSALAQKFAPAGKAPLAAGHAAAQTVASSSNDAEVAAAIVAAFAKSKV